VGTIKNKAAIAAALAAIALPLSAHAQVAKLQEEQCLHLGRYAEHVAEGIQLGISEKDMVDANLASKKASAETKATMNSIISFVFTMKQPGPELRKIVYLKCKAGEYDPAPARKR
jgi:hypothetical protein